MEFGRSEAVWKMVRPMKWEAHLSQQSGTQETLLQGCQLTVTHHDLSEGTRWLKITAALAAACSHLDDSELLSYGNVSNCLISMLRASTVRIGWPAGEFSNYDYTSLILSPNPSATSHSLRRLQPKVPADNISAQRHFCTTLPPNDASAQQHLRMTPSSSSCSVMSVHTVKSCSRHRPLSRSLLCLQAPTICLQTAMLMFRSYRRRVHRTSPSKCWRPPSFMPFHGRCRSTLPTSLPALPSSVSHPHITYTLSSLSSLSTLPTCPAPISIVLCNRCRR